MGYIILIIFVIFIAIKVGVVYFLIGTVLIVGTILFFQAGSDRKKKEHHDWVVQNQRSKIKSLINKHARELSTKKQQKITDRGYGLRSTEKWEQEKNYFIRNVIRPEFSEVLILNGKELSDLMDYTIDRFEMEHPVPANSGCSVNCTPVEYEQLCASLLQRAGWHAHTTKASGDQGADVIATKNGVKIILQCKKYTGSVGNKAVQEAHAAKSFYDAHKAIVVTNSTYTISAKEAANKLGVLLLHHNETELLSISINNSNEIYKNKTVSNEKIANIYVAEILPSIEKYSNDDF